MIPFAIPGMGASLTFVFTVLLTLMAWLVLKWDKLKTPEPRIGPWESIMGIGLVAADFLENFIRGPDLAWSISLRSW